MMVFIAQSERECQVGYLRVRFISKRPKDFFFFFFFFLFFYFFYNLDHIIISLSLSFFFFR